MSRYCGGIPLILRNFIFSKSFCNQIVTKYNTLQNHSSYCSCNSLQLVSPFKNNIKSFKRIRSQIHSFVFALYNICVKGDNGEGKVTLNVEVTENAGRSVAYITEGKSLKLSYLNVKNADAEWESSDPLPQGYMLKTPN